VPKTDAPTEIELLQARLAETEARLAEAQELINAIHSGDVDAVVVSGPQGEQVFTLKGAEYAYRALVEAMHEGAATLNADGTVLYCNQHLATLIGLPSEQIIGHQAAPLFGPDADNFYKLFVNALCGDTAKAAIDLHTAFGTERPVQISLNTMKTDDPAAICMVVTDLADIRKSESALRDSQSSFATLANLVPQLVWMCGPDGLNFYFNQRWVEYTGLTVEESYGAGWNRPFHPDDKQAAWDAWNHATLTHEQYRVESRLRAADGSYRWFLMRGEPLEDADGNVIRWFGTCTDIDDMKQAEAELREHRQHLGTLVTERTLQLQVVNSQLKADIAERERAEAALHTSEERYRSLFETLIEGFCVIDVIFDDQDRPVDYRFLEINPAFEAQTGLHNAQGKLMRDLAPDHEPHWFEIYGGVALTGRPIRFVNEARALNRWYEVSAYRVGGPESRQVAILFNDISDNKRAEDALRASEGQFRTLANSIPHLCWMAEAGGSIFWYNERWYQYTGCTPDETEGWGWQSVVDPDVLPQVLERWRNSIATGEPFEMIFPLLGVDGVFHPFLTLVMPVCDSHRKVVRWFGTHTDITTGKQAEDALRASETRFRALFENSLDAVFLTVPDGEVLAANPAACKMFGMSEAELCRAGREGITDPDDSRQFAAILERQQTGHVSKAEMSYVRANGEKFPCETDSVILQGDPPRSFVILRDISERQRVTQALIESEKLASVGRLASTIAHEINNPLEAVGNALYLAIICPETPPLVKSYLDMASEELERVTHVTRQTLEFHRNNNTPMHIDLCECLEGVLNLYKGKIKTRDITVERRYTMNQPIHGVSSEIRQIITNLLSNSLDALQNGGRLVCSITRSVGRGGSPAVRLTIADNGAGIAPENRQKIFEPFFTTKEFVGTGLGLWIIKQIAEKHGATIRVRSKLQKGTTFSIAFPIPDSNEESTSGSST
jgi:PAS domain S-box-containing protein